MSKFDEMLKEKVAPIVADSITKQADAYNAITVPHQAFGLIKQFEGFSASPYKCPAGTVTIGYGSTAYLNGAPILASDPPIGQECAENLCLAHIKRDLEFLSDDLRVLNINQWSAILSLVYNIGRSALLTSTLFLMIKENKYSPHILDEFLRWNKVRFRGDKIPSLGLTRRRLAEATLYFKSPNIG